MIAENVLELIGDTPLVRLNEVNPYPEIPIYAKLEKLNPMGSVKDRIGWYMIKEAEERDEIDEETIIVEATSGNTGLGLAMVCALKGYHLHLTMSRGVSIERVRMLTALGAEIEFTPEEEGTDGAIKRAKELAERDYFWRPNQFDNEVNVKAHYETTGKEIVKDTEGKLTHFVAGMGTTGTLMGVSKRLRELDREVKVVGVEPTPEYEIQGLKNMEEDMVPSIYDEELLDEVRTIDDEDAFCTARELAIKEGLFVGMSSGAAVHIATEIAKELEDGYIVTLLPDGGEKYFSTDLFDVQACLDCMSDNHTVYHPPEDMDRYLEEMEKVLNEKD